VRLPANARRTINPALDGEGVTGLANRGWLRETARSLAWLPRWTRRECAPTPNAAFCSLGTIRKLAAPKTSLRSAAVMAALRTADLSCAEAGL
jgi:hypothetical protein